MYIMYVFHFIYVCADLGITHEAYATEMWKETGMLSEEVLYNINESIKYMKLRVYSVYKEDFPDERWAIMLALGNIYAMYFVSMYIFCFIRI